MNAIHVLVVDDDFLIREMTKLILEQIGCTIIGEAADGLEAIELSKSLKPDVVLMDMEMPKMNGLEATQHCSMPVVMLTAGNLSEIAEPARAVGVSDCLSKPATAHELRRAIALATAH